MNTILACIILENAIGLLRLKASASKGIIGKCTTILALALLLSACGFHLRGSFSIPLQLQPLAIDSKTGQTELGITLTQMLEAAGVTVSDQAKYTLYIISETSEKRRITSSKTDFYDEYMLINNTTFDLRNNAGIVVYGPRQIVAMTLFQDDKSNPTGKDEEKDLLLRELHADSALQIIRRLSSASIQEPATSAIDSI